MPGTMLHHLETHVASSHAHARAHRTAFQEGVGAMAGLEILTSGQAKITQVNETNRNLLDDLKESYEDVRQAGTRVNKVWDGFVKGEAEIDGEIPPQEDEHENPVAAERAEEAKQSGAHAGSAKEAGLLKTCGDLRALLTEIEDTRPSCAQAQHVWASTGKLFGDMNLAKMMGGGKGNKAPAAPAGDTAAAPAEGGAATSALALGQGQDDGGDGAGASANTAGVGKDPANSQVSSLFDRILRTMGLSTGFVATGFAEGDAPGKPGGGDAASAAWNASDPEAAGANTDPQIAAANMKADIDAANHPPPVGADPQMPPPPVKKKNQLQKELAALGKIGKASADELNAASELAVKAATGAPTAADKAAVAAQRAAADTAVAAGETADSLAAGTAAAGKAVGAGVVAAEQGAENAVEGAVDGVEGAVEAVEDAAEDAVEAVEDAAESATEVAKAGAEDVGLANYVGVINDPSHPEAYMEEHEAQAQKLVKACADTSHTHDLQGKTCDTMDEQLLCTYLRDGILPRLHLSRWFDPSAGAGGMTDSPCVVSDRSLFNRELIDEADFRANINLRHAGEVEGDSYEQY